MIIAQVVTVAMLVDKMSFKHFAIATVLFFSLILFLYGTN